MSLGFGSGVAKPLNPKPVSGCMAKAFSVVRNTPVDSQTYSAPCLCDAWVASKVRVPLQVHK